MTIRTVRKGVFWGTSGSALLLFSNRAQSVGKIVSLDTIG